MVSILLALNTPVSVQADGPVGGFDRDDFERIAEEGFGDPMNNYVWAMGYFKGDLYVGTGRNSTWAVLNRLGLPLQITDIVFQEITVPSGTPGSEEFANDMRGEIWRYHDGEWERVYQAAVRWWGGAGVWLPDEIGFRGKMVTFTNTWGEETIYAARAGATPPMHVILKSTDGTTWERVITPLQTFGTPRAMAVHNGKLYVGGGEAGPSGGGPFIWATDDPSTTSYNFTKVADFTTFGPGTNTAVGSLASFNGYLYAGVDNRETGFQVFRSTEEDPELGDWTQIVNFGAGDMHNWRAACMDILDNQLYVGSLSLPSPGDAPGFMLPKGFEIIRIDTEDDWELVVGDCFPRVPAPDVTIPRTPISGWPGGFGNFFNWYCWSMQAHEDVLYIGSFDASSFLRFLPEELLDLFPELTEEQQEQIVSALEEVIGLLEDQGVDEYWIEAFEQLLEAFLPTDEPVDWEEVCEIFTDHFSGADLWKTEDGIIWQPVTLNGFDNPDNYGFRNMVAVNPLFVGTANPFEGLEIWQAPPQGEGESCDEVEVGKDVFAWTDDVYATGSGFQPNTDVDVYIVSDLAWSDGDDIPPDIGDGVDTVTTDDYGNFGPAIVWEAPLTPGEYDIVFDVDRDEVYDAIGDYVDDPNHPGFIVLLPPPMPVGGEVYPVSKLAILAPWIALAMLLIGGISWLTLRRRRAAS